MGTGVKAGAKQGEVWADQIIVSGSIQSQSLGVPLMSTYSTHIQVGQAGSVTGSSRWIAYDTAFSAVPRVYTQDVNVGELGAVDVGSVTIGSFFALTEASGLPFDWLAIGTKA